MSERPDESPYHIIGEVASALASSTEPTREQNLEVISNQATAGSWGLEDEGKERLDAVPQG
jgi:hypothetical protein